MSSTAAPESNTEASGNRSDVAALYLLLITAYVLLGLYAGRRINVALGRALCWFSLILVLITLCDVVLRYLFTAGSVAVQELEWHVFSLIFLLCSGFALAEEQHVRVDLLYGRCSRRTKAAINVFGTLFFLLPFCALVVWTSIPLVEASFRIMERSPDPGGLPWRFLVKGAVPAGFLLIGLQGLWLLRTELGVLVRGIDREALPES